MGSEDTYHSHTPQHAPAEGLPPWGACTGREHAHNGAVFSHLLAQHIRTHTSHLVECLYRLYIHIVMQHRRRAYKL